MSFLAGGRTASFQSACTFLYPASCFTSSLSSATALRTTTARFLARPTKNHNCHSIDTNRHHGSPLSRRYLTTSARRLGRAEMGPKMPSMSMPAPKSYKVSIKEEIGKRGLPNDIGLFENTLIMPTGKSKPGIFSKPRLRAALEWQRISSRSLDILRMIIYKFTIGKPRPRMRVWKTAGIAKTLHAKTFKAFAAGDMATLNTICVDGVLRQFSNQIAARPKNVKYVWTLHKYLGRPRVVSHKAAILNAGSPTMGQRQAVVKIRSLQSLTKVDTGKSGSPQTQAITTKTEEPQKKCDYFVIQQRYTEGVGAGDWLVWGTTSEKGWEDILERAGYEHLLSEAKGEKTADIAGK